MSAPALCSANTHDAKHQPAMRAPASYPKLLIQRVVERVGLSYRVPVLALGTEARELALELAPFAKSVTLLGHEDAWLASSAVLPSVRNKLRLEQATNLDVLPEQLGRFRLAVVSGPFRRLERAATLTALDARLDLGGAVALFELRYPRVGENSWRESVDALIARYEPEWAPPSSTEIASDEAVLLQSAFDHVERLSLLERRETPIRTVFERALTQLGIEYGASGRREPQFARELHGLLAGHARDGVLHEIVDGHVLVARRAKDLSGRWA